MLLIGGVDISTACAAAVRSQLIDDSPKVAEPFWLSVTVSADEGANVIFPEVPAAIGPFQVLSNRDWFDVPTEANRTWTRHFELESLQGGELRIPAIEVSVDGTTMASDPLALTINSLVEKEADPTTFREFKNPIDIPDEQTEKRSWPMWVLIGAATVSVLALATWWLAFRKKGIAPDAWALLQLEQLRSSEENPLDDAAAFSRKIANVLRQYIERRFQISATRQTTDEFLAKAKSDSRLSESEQSRLHDFLSHIDEVKFGKLTPGSHNVQEAFQLVDNFVRATAGERQ